MFYGSADVPMNLGRKSIGITIGEWISDVSHPFEIIFFFQPPAQQNGKVWTAGGVHDFAVVFFANLCNLFAGEYGP